jgi:hypothetical protein
MNETFAVLDGRTPFVDFHAQYGQLLPYVAAAIMALAGSATIGAWTLIMTSISGLATLAIYDVFRRVTRSSLLALVIFLPFLASGFFQLLGPSSNRFSLAGTFSLWPMRYAGPYLLAWLTARHVDAVAPRRAPILLLAAGLVALNNAEFGIGAFLATLAALACHTPPGSWRAAGRLVANAVAGLLGAALLVTLLSLVRTGALPDFILLLEFSRLYGIGGWVLEPMAPMGFHIAMYVTFTAAIVAATVCAARSEPQRVLTSMLAWSGVFGLFAGSYYVGRSDPLDLVSLLSAWCLSVTLLLVLVAGRLASRDGPRATLPEIAVVFGFCLSACSLAQFPLPWAQVARLRVHSPDAPFKQADAAQFVAAATQPGEKVVILIPLGHRIAYDLGLVDIAPYSSIDTMPTVGQMQSTIAVARREHVHKIFFSPGATSANQLKVLTQAGFSLYAQGYVSELTDLGP